MAATLAPCPYCHSHDLHFVHHLLTHAVCCQHCGACGPSQRQVEDAVTQWNGVAQHLAQLPHLQETRAS